VSRPLSAAADAALEPVRVALLAAARAEAAEVARQAEVQSSRLREEARCAADRMIADARAAGEATATAALAVRLARSRREARRSALSAQHGLYEELRRRCRQAAASIAGTAEYELLRRRLVDRAREQLGMEADVVDSPDGGILASVGSRRVDLSLPALADRALARSGPEVAALWTA